LCVCVCGSRGGEDAAYKQEALDVLVCVCVSKVCVCVCVSKV
jgi:hypothetical protein